MKRFLVLRLVLRLVLLPRATAALAAVAVVVLCSCAAGARLLPRESPTNDRRCSARPVSPVLRCLAYVTVFFLRALATILLFVCLFAGGSRGDRAVDADGSEGVRRPTPQPLAQLSRVQGHG